MASVCIVEGKNDKYFVGDTVFIDYSYGEIVGKITTITDKMVILEIGEKIKGQMLNTNFNTKKYHNILIEDILSCSKWIER